MLILLKPGASEQEIAEVVSRIEGLSYRAHLIPGARHTAVGITGNKGPVDPEPFLMLAGVAECIPVTQPYKLVARQAQQEGSGIDFDGVQIGGAEFVVMAGPCAVESREQIVSTAQHVKKHGASILRGGAFKPRTSPYDFQGLKEDGLKLLKEAKDETGLPIITEVKDVHTLGTVAAYADILQVGARNMQNYSLLEAVGDQDKPVMLKRGLSATVKEWLMAAEYIAARGNTRIMLCERGVRTFETITRNTLDLGMVPSLRELTHLPIVIDPSHGTGIARSVPALARAALVVGADAVMVEVHPDPMNALSDGPQSLTFEQFAKMAAELTALRATMRQLS